MIVLYPSNEELLKVEVPSWKYTPPLSPDSLKFTAVILLMVTLPATYNIPPLPHGVEVLLKSELLMSALVLSRKIAPPLYDAPESVKLHESIVTLVELIHAIHPPLLSAKIPLNVTLFMTESLQLITVIVPIP